jgi:hypothetical protein
MICSHAAEQHVAIMKGIAEAATPPRKFGTAWAPGLTAAPVAGHVVPGGGPHAS